MNVYDFDDTIYDGDSMTHFFLFCLRKYPGVWLCVPRLAAAGAALALKRMSRDAAKEMALGYLRRVPDAGAAVEDFWHSHKKRLRAWYLAQKEETDVVISASPHFTLAPVCAQLRVALIASPIDAGTGRLAGPNCRGEEKVRRFRREYPDAVVEEFYSDSLSDTPMAKLARRAFLVKGETRRPWPGLS